MSIGNETDNSFTKGTGCACIVTYVYIIISLLAYTNL